MAGANREPVADPANNDTAVDPANTDTFADPANTDTARRAAEVAVEVSEAGGQERQERARRGIRGVAGRASSALTGVAAGARRGGGSARGGLSHGLNWLSAQVIAMAPRLKIRDQAALRKAFPGRSDEEIGGLLIEHAARAAAAVGAATGVWAALPTLPSFPAEVAAETLAVVGIEIKLVAELHEIYGMPAQGSATDRARAYIGSWATRKGIYQVEGGLVIVAGSPLARALTRRLARRARQSTFSLAPLFTGAVAGAMFNRRETRRVGRQIRDELRRYGQSYTATVVR